MDPAIPHAGKATANLGDEGYHRDCWQAVNKCTLRMEDGRCFVLELRVRLAFLSREDGMRLGASWE